MTIGEVVGLNSRTLEVSRSDFGDTRIREDVLPALSDGEILVEVDRFGLSTNNVTYAVAGEELAYWSVFPAEGGFGRVPAWGFGHVVESRSEDIAEGSRVYGLFPMGTHAILRPGHIHPHQFLDVCAHRRSVDPGYNTYYLTNGHPMFMEELNDRHAILGQLFITGFLISDYLVEHEFFGAKQVLISSASSKTAICLAAILSERTDIEVRGLTSEPNLPFSASVEYYSAVSDYARLGELKRVPTVYVDMSGNADLLSRLQACLGDHLKRSLAVGATHKDGQYERSKPGSVDAAGTEVFFSPSQAGSAIRRLGMQSFYISLLQGLHRTLKGSEAWMELDQLDGLEAAARVWKALHANTAKPNAGYLMTLTGASRD